MEFKPRIYKYVFLLCTDFLTTSSNDLTDVRWDNVAIKQEDVSSDI
ncbi:Uncharacterized protein ChrSV_2353 [Chromobacterium vaccinii]|nr:Uncharacterized protein ChrSW_2353 [Chromobacterium vaccinii]QND89810.1 Uncharacterized protein ChrSV_2353 [Chromobacterium vaccinii]